MTLDVYEFLRRFFLHVLPLRVRTHPLFRAVRSSAAERGAAFVPAAARGIKPAVFDGSARFGSVSVDLPHLRWSDDGDRAVNGVAALATGAA